MLARKLFWDKKNWKNAILNLINFSAVHTMLNDLLPDHIYFRFNPYLTEMLSMVEIRPEKISLMEQDARMYIRRNEEKFQKAAIALLEKRRLQQKIVDYITLQKQLLTPWKGTYFTHWCAFHNAICKYFTWIFIVQISYPLHANLKLFNYCSLLWIVQYTIVWIIDMNFVVFWCNTFLLAIFFFVTSYMIFV